MTNDQLILLQNLPLDIKIEKTKQRIREWVNHFGLSKVYVSYSGGKDSEVLVDIARKLYPDIKIVFVNTTQEFPETIKQVLKRKKEGYNIQILNPKKTFTQVIEEHGYPVISKEQSQYIREARDSTPYMKQRRIHGDINGRFKISSKWKHLIDSDFKISEKCCFFLKKEPVKRFERESGRHGIIGTMAEESNLRKQLYIKTGCNSFNSKRPLSKPLGFWREQDIWKYIRENNLKISEMYTKHGRTRTGCYGCLFGCHLEQSKTGTNRISELKKTHPALYNYLMKKLKYNHIMEVLKLKL